MTAPGNATYIKLVYRLLDVIGDQADGDVNPDWVPLPAGTTVTIRHPVTKVIDSSSTPPVSFYPQPITCLLNATGDILDPQGQVGVWVLNPNNPAMNPNGYTLLVDINIPGRNAETFNLGLVTPNGDGSYDITLNSPVSAATGGTVTQGVPGLPGDQVLPYVNNNAASGAITLNLSSGSVQRYQVVGTTTFTLYTPSDATKAVTLTLTVKQDATGNRTVTLPTGVKWTQGVPPVPSTGANTTDIYTFMWTTDTGWVGFVSGLAVA